MLSLQEEFFSKLDIEKSINGRLHYIVLYCTVLYCTVRIALHCIVLYCIVLYCIVLYCIVLYCIVLYCIVSCPYVLFGERFAAVTNKHTNRSGSFAHMRGLGPSLVYIQFLCDYVWWERQFQQINY